MWVHTTSYVGSSVCPPRVADRGGDDAGHLAERLLDAPEAAGRERRQLVAGARRQRRPVAGVPGIGADAVRARGSGQRLGPEVLGLGGVGDGGGGALACKGTEGEEDREEACRGSHAHPVRAGRPPVSESYRGAGILADNGAHEAWSQAGLEDRGRRAARAHRGPGGDRRVGVRRGRRRSWTAPSPRAACAWSRTGSSASGSSISAAARSRSSTPATTPRARRSSPSSRAAGSARRRWRRCSSRTATPTTSPAATSSPRRPSTRSPADVALAEGREAGKSPIGKLMGCQAHGDQDRARPHRRRDPHARGQEREGLRRPRSYRRQRRVPGERRALPRRQRGRRARTARSSPRPRPSRTTPRRTAPPSRPSADRLRPEAAEVKALVPAHSGVLQGLGPLLAFGG